jgi:hypothetical protein
MSKLLSLFTAGALALAASGFVSAADEPYPSSQTGQSQTQKETAPANQPSQNETTPGNTDQQSAEYLAALKKCDAINNAGDRQKCVDAAKKKHGQM